MRADDAIRLHLVPAFGSRPLGSLTPLDVQKLVNEFSANASHPQPPARTTQCSRAILNSALNADLIARSPCRGIKLPRVAPKERVIVGPDEIHRLAEAIAPEYRAMVLVRGRARFPVGRVRRAPGSRRRRTPAHRDGPPQRGRSPRCARYRRAQDQRRASHRRCLAQLMATIAEHLRRRGLTARNADAWVFAAPVGGPLLYSHFRQRVWLPAVRKADLARAPRSTVCATPRRRRGSPQGSICAPHSTASATRRPGSSWSCTRTLRPSS